MVVFVMIVVGIADVTLPNEILNSFLSSVDMWQCLYMHEYNQLQDTVAATATIDDSGTSDGSAPDSSLSSGNSLVTCGVDALGPVQVPGYGYLQLRCVDCCHRQWFL